jgi:hypothetical protein
MPPFMLAQTCMAGCTIQVTSLLLFGSHPKQTVLKNPCKQPNTCTSGCWSDLAEHVAMMQDYKGVNAPTRKAVNVVSVDAYERYLKGEDAEVPKWMQIKGTDNEKVIEKKRRALKALKKKKRYEQGPVVHEGTNGGTTVQRARHRLLSFSFACASMVC